MEYHEYKKRFEEAGIKGEYLLSNNEFLTLVNEYKSSFDEIVVELDNFLFIDREDYLNGKRLSSEEINEGKTIVPAYHWFVKKRIFNTDLGSDYFGEGSYDFK